MTSHNNDDVHDPLSSSPLQHRQQQQQQQQQKQQQEKQQKQQQHWNNQQHEIPIRSSIVGEVERLDQTFCSLLADIGAEVDYLKGSLASSSSSSSSPASRPSLADRSKSLRQSQDEIRALEAIATRLWRRVLPAPRPSSRGTAPAPSATLDVLESFHAANAAALTYYRIAAASGDDAKNIPAVRFPQPARQKYAELPPRRPTKPGGGSQAITDASVSRKAIGVVFGCSDSFMEDDEVGPPRTKNERPSPYFPYGPPSSSPDTASSASSLDYSMATSLNQQLSDLDMDGTAVQSSPTEEEQATAVISTPLPTGGKDIDSPITPETNPLPTLRKERRYPKLFNSMEKGGTSGGMGAGITKSGMATTGTMMMGTKKMEPTTTGAIMSGKNTTTTAWEMTDMEITEVLPVTTPSQPSTIPPLPLSSSSNQSTFVRTALHKTFAHHAEERCSWEPSPQRDDFDDGNKGDRLSLPSYPFDPRLSIIPSTQDNAGDTSPAGPYPNTNISHPPPSQTRCEYPPPSSHAPSPTQRPSLHGSAPTSIMMPMLPSILTLNPISVSEYASAPRPVRTQVSLVMANRAIEALNAWLSQTFCQDDPDDRDGAQSRRRSVELTEKEAQKIITVEDSHDAAVRRILLGLCHWRRVTLLRRQKGEDGDEDHGDAGYRFVIGRE